MIILDVGNHLIPGCKVYFFDVPRAIWYDYIKHDEIHVWCKTNKAVSERKTTYHRFVRYKLGLVRVKLPDGCKVQYSEFDVEYCDNDGLLHNTKGPAYLRVNSRKSIVEETYFIHGERYTEDEFKMISFTLYKEKQNAD